MRRRCIELRANVGRNRGTPLHEPTQYAFIAQQAERPPCKREVYGSIPSESSNKPCWLCFLFRRNLSVRNDVLRTQGTTYRISPKVRRAALNRVKAGQYRHSVPTTIFIHPTFHKEWLMNELDRIREQIKRMRVKGVEPGHVIMCYELWDSLGRPHRFSRVECYPDDGVLGRFEVR